MWQNFLHRQQGIAEGITVFLGNLLKAAAQDAGYTNPSALSRALSRASTPNL